MPPKQAAAPYAVDERVFCFHMDMLYEARVLDVQQVTGAAAADGQKWRYRIHYKGWKNTWDDWVPADRVRKFNDENRDLAAQLRDQARLLQQQKNAKAKKAAQAGGPGGPGGGSGGGRSSLAAAAAGIVGGGPGGPGSFGGGGSGTGTATPGERGGRDHHHLLDRHSEMASARGSEERTGAGSLAHARGPRRQRDYDLEHVSDLFCFILLDSAHVFTCLHCCVLRCCFDLFRCISCRLNILCPAVSHMDIGEIGRPSLLPFFVLFGTCLRACRPARCDRQ